MTGRYSLATGVSLTNVGVRVGVPVRVGVAETVAVRVTVGVAVPVGESSVLRVPASALIQRGQLEIAFVETGQRAQLRLVKTGKRYGSEVEIVSGIADGESVVTDGVARLRDGQPVQIRP